MDLSILIAYRDREENLLAVLTQIKRNLLFFKQKLEVIVVDLGSKKNLSSIEEKFPFVSYHYISYSGTFCKSWALNLAFKQSGRPWLFLLDVDCIFFEKLLANLVPLVQPEDPGRFYLFKSIRDLPGNLTQLIQQKGIITGQLKSIMEEHFNNMDNQGGVGNLLVHRENYERLSGYDEHMFAWGRRDSDFYYRLLAAGIEEVPVPVEPGLSLFHLHHHRGEITYNNLLSFYQNDFVEIYNKTNHILAPNSPDQWGDPDRPPDQYRYESLLQFDVEMSAENLPVLKVNGSYFDNPANPFDLQTQFDGIDAIIDPAVPLIILGGGLNYAYKVLSEKAEQVYIIEKYKAVKDLACEHNGIDPTRFMDTDIRHMFDFLARMETLNPKTILVHKPSYELDRDWYNAVNNVILSKSAV
jgi:glycosyltransferase involved in cell wall biosynthesis